MFPSNPENQLSNCHSCIYCPAKLPSSRKEHFFNAAWGGRNKSSRLICNACNSQFSDDFDEAFTPYTQLIRNVWNISTRNSAPPIIHTTGDLKILPQSKLYMEPKIQFFKDQEDKFTVNLRASSWGEVKRLLADDQKAIGTIGRPLSDSEKADLRKKINFKRSWPGTEDGCFQVSLDLPLQIKSAAHTCLKVLRAYFPNYAVSNELRSIREFITKHQDRNWQQFTFDGVLISGLDSSNHCEKQLGGPFFSSVTIIWSEHHNMVVGKVKILGRLERWVILQKNYRGPSGILIALEGINNGGELLASHASFGNLMPKLFDIKKQTLTEQYFGKEYFMFDRKVLGFDVYRQQIEPGISELLSKHSIVTTEFIDDFTQRLNFRAQQFARLFRREVSENQFLDMVVNLISTNVTPLLNLETKELVVASEMRRCVLSMQDQVFSFLNLG